jgi:hypothetical protein
LPLDINTLISTSRAAPQLDPNLATTLASGGYSAGDAVTIGQATEGMGSMTAMSGSLQKQAPAAQIKLWNGFDESTRSMLSASGYTPPAEAESANGHKGFWGGITKFFNRVGDDIVHPMQGLGDAAKALSGAPLIGPALQLAGVPLRAEQHAYRAFRDIELGATSDEDAKKAFAPTAGWSMGFSHLTPGKQHGSVRRMVNAITTRTRSATSRASTLLT